MTPVPPYGHPLNHAMQAVATAVLWTGVAVLVLYAARLSRRERSPIPIMIVVAAGTGSLIEPLYDISYHLLWYVHGQWTLFTAFGLPQPVWVMPAYIMVFALPAIILYRRLAAGATVGEVFRFAALFSLTTAAFEITAINLNLYGYYGQAPMRVLHYPLWIAVMEGTQITGYAVLAATLRRRATRPQHALALLVVFPANFAFETLGAGFPGLMSINTPAPQGVVMWLAAAISMALAATGLWWTAQLLVAGRSELAVPTGSTSDRRLPVPEDRARGEDVAAERAAEHGRQPAGGVEQAVDVDPLLDAHLVEH